METYSSRYSAQRSARRSIGSDDALDGVHFTTGQTADRRWTFKLIPGSALDALTANVRSAVAEPAIRVGAVATPLSTDDEASVPEFVKATFRKIAVGKPIEAVATVETAATKKKQPPAKASKTEQLRKLREKNAAKPKTAAKPAAKSATKRSAPADVVEIGPRLSLAEAAIAAAKTGAKPTPPDFSAETHRSYRKRLDTIVEAFGKGDLATLKADKTEPASPSRKMLCRFRDAAIAYLEAGFKP